MKSSSDAHKGRPLHMRHYVSLQASLYNDGQAYMPRIRVTVATRLMATMYAAVRKSTRYLIEVCSTALNASHVLASSRSFTSLSVQKYPYRSCTHSKYD